MSLLDTETKPVVLQDHMDEGPVVTILLLGNAECGKSTFLMCASLCQSSIFTSANHQLNTILDC